jgi:hypothetical protein
MQYFRFLPDPAKLRKEARWSGVSSVPGIGQRVPPSSPALAKSVVLIVAESGAGTGSLELVSRKVGPSAYALSRRVRFSERNLDPCLP